MSMHYLFLAQKHFDYQARFGHCCNRLAKKTNYIAQKDPDTKKHFRSPSERRRLRGRAAWLWERGPARTSRPTWSWLVNAFILYRDRSRNPRLRARTARLVCRVVVSGKLVLAGKQLVGRRRRAAAAVLAEDSTRLARLFLAPGPGLQFSV